MFPRQQKHSAPLQASRKIRRESSLQSAEQQSTQPLISLQQNIGNSATQRVLQAERADQDARQNNILSLQPVIGNSGVQRMLKTPTIQRELFMTSADLSGKKAGGLFDNALSSTFRAIEVALNDFHKANPDDIPTRDKLLRLIVKNCREWLDDKAHKKASDDVKRNSLNTLVEQAKQEFHRIAITKELGVPRILADQLKPPQVTAFFEVVLAFERNDATSALKLFAASKPALGDGGNLIEGFMKRNHITQIDPALGGIMTNSKFEMKSDAANADAITLIKKQAQEKLTRLTKLKADAAAAEALYRADMVAKRNQVSFNDLPADKKALYAKIEEKGYPPDPMKIIHYPILQAGTPEALEYSKLGIEQDQYKALISGDAVKAKSAEKGFKKFTETELYGLMGYTSNLYGAINAPLRFDVGDRTKFTAGHTALTGAITSALNKLKPYKGEVFRHDGDFKGYSSVNVDGAIVSSMSPYSTAVDQKGPASAAEQHEVLEIITSVSGRDVSKMSMFGSKEGEVLFAPGTHFRVVAAFERNRAFWGKAHDESQWRIRGQDSKTGFARAMGALAADDRKNDFHRVVIKVEVA